MHNFFHTIFILLCVASTLYAPTFRFPDLKRILIEYTPEQNEDLLHFLQHYAPSKTKVLYFTGAAQSKIDFYLGGLEKAIPTATKEVYIYKWNLSKASLERVIKASANATRIIVRFSKIDCSQDFDLRGPSYNANYFGLPYCGDEVGEEWSSNPAKLERIIKAIANTNMKQSLQTFNVWECGVETGTVVKLLAKHGMSNVIVEEKDIFESSE